MSRAKLAKAVFWAAFLFTYVMAVLPHPPEVPGSPSDKIQHMLAFATLGILAGMAFPRTSLPALLVRLSLFGAVIELTQAIPALNRDSDLVDWLADIVACALALAAFGLWRRKTNDEAG